MEVGLNVVVESVGVRSRVGDVDFQIDGTAAAAAAAHSDLSTAGDRSGRATDVTHFLVELGVDGGIVFPYVVSHISSGILSHFHTLEV